MVCTAAQDVARGNQSFSRILGLISPVLDEAKFITLCLTITGALTTLH